MPSLTKEQLWNELKAGKIAPVYLLYGAESFLRDAAAKTIADRVFSEGELRDFNENEFALTTSESDAFVRALGAAEQLPMMASRRVVRITNVKLSLVPGRETLKEASEPMLARYLERPAESSVVIFIADEFDKRRRISKALLDKACSVEFQRLQGKEIVGWIKKEIRDLGFDIEERAAFHLAGLVDDDLHRLKNEIGKLVTAALPDRIVTYALVESLVSNSRELSNFDLTNHIFSGDRRKTLHTLKKILDDGAEPLMLLGLLAFNVRKLMMASELMSTGAERKQVLGALKVHPTHHESFLKIALRVKREKMAEIIERLAAADLAIKTSRGGGGPSGARMQLELVVAEISRA